MIYIFVSLAMKQQKETKLFKNTSYNNNINNYAILCDVPQCRTTLAPSTGRLRPTNSDITSALRLQIMTNAPRRRKELIYNGESIKNSFIVIAFFNSGVNFLRVHAVLGFFIFLYTFRGGWCATNWNSLKIMFNLVRSSIMVIYLQRLSLRS